MRYPQRRVINIVDSVDSRSAGIWKAAVSTAKELSAKSWMSELWFPGDVPSELGSMVTPVQLASRSMSTLTKLITGRELRPERDVIVTHGCWHYCTWWGDKLKKIGFKWIYTPHGMLESWALDQKSIKKSIYLKLVEQPKARNATVIRAVSEVEKTNLANYFNSHRIQYIPNGVSMDESFTPRREKIRQYLFLGRLHKKKGVMELVQGWLCSSLNNNLSFRLLIAGPDDGELDALIPLVNSSQNIRYVGTVGGIEKKNLFEDSTFFVLPSFSEGFPTAVLEGMSYGLFPLISRGCNFPEVHEKKIAMRMEPNQHEITHVLEQASTISSNDLNRISVEAREYVKSNFTLTIVARQQSDLYAHLLTS